MGQTRGACLFRPLFVYRLDELVLVEGEWETPLGTRLLAELLLS